VGGVVIFVIKRTCREGWPVGCDGRTVGATVGAVGRTVGENEGAAELGPLVRIVGFDVGDATG
jgi:hypothetical protein